MYWVVYGVCFVCVFLMFLNTYVLLLLLFCSGRSSLLDKMGHAGHAGASVRTAVASARAAVPQPEHEDQVIIIANIATKDVDLTVSIGRL
jgi:hypothetical protein